MKKVPNWLIVLIVIALLVSVKFLFLSKKDAGSVGQNTKKPVPLSVNYFVAKAVPYENKVFCTGIAGAFNQVELLPEIAAKVIRINFNEGDHVSKGDLLVKLNDADFQAQLLKIQTQLKLAIQKLERLKKLREINGVSEEEFEMQANEIAVLKADENFYLAQIAKTEIKAPFDGNIGLKNISEGSFVNSNTPLVSLVQLKPMYVEFTIPGKYSQQFKQGMQVEFVMENELSTKTNTAVVYAIEPKMDEVTKSIRARARYNGDEKILPGSYLKVFLEMGSHEKLLMVPSQCIIPVLKGHKVFVVSGGQSVEKMVHIGPRSDQKVVILDGLAEGDTVITSGLMSVKKETKINLIKTRE
jgi:membrane fusion protein, multidrug efflux system